MRGWPAQMDEIVDIARRQGIFVLENVAQANGGSYGRRLGSIGDARAFSFLIQRNRAQIPTNHNPFYNYDRTSISMDTRKRDQRPFPRASPRIAMPSAGLGA